jgi:multidrug efflux pump subunit AcrA (membrane-fusion protein)
MHKNATSFFRITQEQFCQTTNEESRQGGIYMKKVILLVAVLAVIAAGWFLYFNKSDQITEVSVAEAKVTNLSNTLEFSGQVTPVHMYSVMSETGGTVDALYVKEGDEVDAGDKLFNLDDSALKIQLEEAQLQYKMLSDSSAQAAMAQNGGAGDAERSLQEQQIKVALALSQTTGYDYESFNSAFADTAQDAASEMAASLSGMTLDDIQNASTSTTASGEDQIELAGLSVQSL